MEPSDLSRLALHNYSSFQHYDQYHSAGHICLSLADELSDLEPCVNEAMVVISTSPCSVAMSCTSHPPAVATTPAVCSNE